jgi:hypothetical protein
MKEEYEKRIAELEESLKQAKVKLKSNKNMYDTNLKSLKEKNQKLK